MKTLHFDYQMKIHYTVPVSVCHFTIKCLPVTDDRQMVKDLKVELFPNVNYQEGTDGFGNRQIYGCVRDMHDTFVFHVSGDVRIGQILYEEMADEDLLAVFRHPYQLTQPGEALLNYYKSIPLKEEMTDYEKCVCIMHKLHEDFTYEKNVTNMNTTAEEAWVLGKGVCQDYAHIMIALVQMAGIPARYVTGMLIGEGASHAWVEILWKDKWIGMDPTNDVLVADFHIKIGHGRDASDCLINRGVMKGGGDQMQTISVSVEEK